MPSRMMLFGLVVMVLRWTSGPIALSQGPLKDAASQTFRQSDICLFVEAPTVAEFQRWCVTAVPWGGGEEYGARQIAHDAGVRLVATNLGTLHEMGAYMSENEEAWRRSWVHGYREGISLPSWHNDDSRAAILCTLDPAFRQRLLDRAAAIGRTKPDAFHIDDPAVGATALNARNPGCFCERCMAGFTQYLSDHLSADELSAQGITSLSGFNYYDYLKARFPDSLPPDRDSGVPLWFEFRDYQFAEAARLIRELFETVDREAGRHVPAGANAHPGDPLEGLPLMPYLDYTASEEWQQGASGEPNTEAVFHYKMGEAQGVQVVANGSGWDWDAIIEHERPALVRSWIAQAYAFGHFLVFPRYQWAYTREHGQRWYEPDPRHYLPLARFIRGNERAFDGYQTVAPVGLLYTRGGRGPHHLEVVQWSERLIANNVPFCMIVAGDATAGQPLEEKALNAVRYLIIPASAKPGVRDQTLLDAWAGREGHVLLRGASEQVSFDELPMVNIASVSDEGESGREVRVIATLRSNHERAEAPFVLHLLNRDYDKRGDCFIPATGVEIEIRGFDFGAQPLRSAEIAGPYEPLRVVPLTGDAGAPRLALPQLNEWAIVRLKP